MFTNNLLEIPVFNPLLAELQPGYTFDRFSLNDGSMEALYMVLSLVEEKDDVKYPVVIHGEKGLGKTHLLHGAIHYLRDHVPERKVVLINGEYVKCAGRTYLDENIIKECRGADFLFIDDFEVAFQSEYKEVFMNLVELCLKMNKPLLVAMSKYTEILNGMDVTIRNLFLSGTIQEVRYPSKMYCTRILRKELREKYPEVRLVSNEAMELVVECADATIVSLRGYFMNVMAHALLEGREVIDFEFTESILHGRHYQ